MTADQLKAKGFVEVAPGDWRRVAKANLPPESAAGATGTETKRAIVGIQGSGGSTDEQKLNKLERDFLAHLRALHPGEWIGIQNITLKLADDCRYLCDFWTCHGGGLQGWEVKGFRREDAWIKLKVAARLYAPAGFYFTLVERIKGEWKFTDVKP